MKANEAVKTRRASIALFLGIVSLVAIFISMLVLNDIYHGEDDLGQEWMALRICFAVIFIFQVFALLTFWRIIREKNHGGA
jgi:hypothetical protein